MSPYSVFSQNENVQIIVLVHLCLHSISEIIPSGKTKQGRLFHDVPASSFWSGGSENSTVRGNDCQNSPPENKLISCLIEVAPIQVRRFAIHASCQFPDHLKSDSFSLCSDSHIHFLLIPLTLMTRFLWPCLHNSTSCVQKISLDGNVMIVLFWIISHRKRVVTSKSRPRLFLSRQTAVSSCLFEPSGKDWIFPHDPQIWSRQKSKKEVWWIR